MTLAKRDPYKIATIVLSIIVICLSFTNIYLNMPSPRLEVGGYPSEPYFMVSNSVTVVVVNPNETFSPATTQPPINSAPYDILNITYQVLNSGKGSAHNVDVKARVEPSNSCSLLATYVYVGNPLPSNLLRVAGDEYNIGILGSGTSYVFTFKVKDGNLNGTMRFFLEVTSDDAGSITREIAYG